MSSATDFRVGDRVILNGEYYDDGIATEHTILMIEPMPKFESGIALCVYMPMVDSCPVAGFEDWIDSGWFGRAK